MHRIKLEYKQMLANAGKRFYASHFSPGFDSGDMSFRDADEGLIYFWPSPNDKCIFYNWGELKAEDIVVVDDDGNYVGINHNEATVELPMHMAIYKARPETTCILHSHPIYSSIFAATGKDIPLCLVEQEYFLNGETRCAKWALTGSKELGDVVVEALGERRKTALLRNHGAVVLGETVDEVMGLSDFLEHTALIVSQTPLWGGAIELDPDNIFDPVLMGNPCDIKLKLQ